MLNGPNPAPPSVKTYADYLSTGLSLGICEPAEAIAWADSQFPTPSLPPDWLINLATSQNKHPLDLIHELDQVPGRAEPSQSAKLLIARLGQAYPASLQLSSRAKISQYHRLISSLYNSIDEDNPALAELATLLLKIDRTLDWLGYIDECFPGVDESEIIEGWNTLRQDHSQLICWGEAYRPYLCNQPKTIS